MRLKSLDAALCPAPHDAAKERLCKQLFMQALERFRLHTLVSQIHRDAGMDLRSQLNQKWWLLLPVAGVLTLTGCAGPSKSNQPFNPADEVPPQFVEVGKH